MSKSNKLKEIFTSKKYDSYAMIGIGIIMILLSILTFTGVLYQSFEKRIIIAWVGIIGGILVTLVGILVVRRELKYKNSVLYDMLEYEDKRIINKLTTLKVLKSNITLIKDRSVTIIVKYNNLSFEVYIHKAKVTFIADCDDKYYQKLDKEKQELLDNLIEEYDSLTINKDELLNKFISFVNKNKYL